MDEEVLFRLGRETGRLLGELGVEPTDDRWIRSQAETVASLVSAGRKRGFVLRFFYRLARKAARIAR